VSAGRRTEIRERLARAGVDVEALTDDFVSYVSVRTHIRDCLDEETGSEQSISTADARGTIEWARSRSEGVIERTIERLARSDAIAAGDVDATHVVRVSCSTCGELYQLDEFLDRGGCDCDASGE
jgi:hypothetical protein